MQVLYVEYNMNNRKRNERFLISNLVRLFPNAKLKITYINTGPTMPLNSDLEKLDVEFQLLQGSNESREFSGWQSAFDLQRDAWSADTVLCICNDTFTTNYGSDYLAWFNAGEVARALQEKAVVGYVDSFSSPMTLFGLSVQCWIRTSFFLARAEVMECAMPLTLPVADHQLFATTGELFREDAPIDARLRQYIAHWLLQGPHVAGESPKVWHSAEPLTESNRLAMQQKAKSILCELYLAARLSSHGYQVFDVRISKSRYLGLLAFFAKTGSLRLLRKIRRSLELALSHGGR